MQDKILLKVTVVTDDDTGIYNIGELDFGIPAACQEYLKNPGNRDKLADWLLVLSEACRNSKSPFEEPMTQEQLKVFSQQLQDAKL